MRPINIIRIVTAYIGTDPLMPTNYGIISVAQLARAFKMLVSCSTCSAWCTHAQNAPVHLTLPPCATRDAPCVLNSAFTLPV